MNREPEAGKVCEKTNQSTSGPHRRTASYHSTTEKRV